MNLISQSLLDEVSAEARLSPRRRKNRNFHEGDNAAAHRLLNALEPDSYVAPHRHLDPAKGETIVALRGRFGVVVFDEGGGVKSTAVLAPGSTDIGINLPAGTYHTLFAIEPGSVFFEAKAGPYVAITPEERAPWAPAEGSAEAPAYLAQLKALFLPNG
jgi:cupin fold WbuC family metalloprotein